MIRDYWYCSLIDTFDQTEAVLAHTIHIIYNNNVLISFKNSRIIKSLDEDLSLTPRSLQESRWSVKDRGQSYFHLHVSCAGEPSTSLGNWFCCWTALPVQKFFSLALCQILPSCNSIYIFKTILFLISRERSPLPNCVALSKVINGEDLLF